MSVSAEKEGRRVVSVALKSILVVETWRHDASHIREEIKRLHVENHVHWVATVTEMIAYLKGMDQFGDREEYPLPAVIIMDLNLRGVDGFEGLEWVRSHEDFCKIAIVVIGREEQMGALRAAVTLGADDWLVKPFDAIEFERVATKLALAVEFAPVEHGDTDNARSLRVIRE
jgi:DNA-binding response OmpR family regulator